MTICEDCGRVVCEPKIVREKVGEFWGDPAYQEREVCPNCGGDLVEAQKCECCGEYYTGEHPDYCGNCLSEAERMIEDCILELQQTYNANHRIARDLLAQFT